MRITQAISFRQATNFLQSLRKFWGFNFSRRFVLMVLVGFVLITLVHSIAATPATATNHSQVILISLDGATP